MNILITGALGFIGSNFVKALLRGSIHIGEIHKITIVDAKTYAANLENLSNEIKNPKLEIIIGNIANWDLISSATKNKSLVINFAAESHVDRSLTHSEKFIESNLLGVYNLLEALKNTYYEKLIQISTDEVYGSINHGFASEEHLLLPNSPYSASKASAEMFINAYFNTYGTPVITTRCSNNYGPYQNIEKFIPLTITNLIDGKTVPIYGNGMNIRDWIHVEDHCRAIGHVINSGINGQSYNISGNFSLTNLELVKLILNKMNLDDTYIEFVEDRLGHDLRYAIDSKKITNLGFEPQLNFDEGISGTIDWYIQNQKWWRTH